MSYLHRGIYGAWSVKSYDNVIQFNNNPPIVLASLAMFPRVHSKDNTVAVVFKAHDGGTATRLLSTGELMTIGPEVTAGNSPIIFGPDGTIYVQHSDGGVVWHYTFDGEYINQLSAPYASEGIHHVTVDGRIVMGNDPSLHGFLNGAEFWGMTTDLVSGITAGQCDGGDTMNGSIGYHYPDGRLEMAQIGNIQIPIQLSVVSGIPFVAACGFDTPEPNQMPREPYRKFGAPPVEPPIPPIDPPVEPPLPGYNPKADLIRVQQQLDAVRVELNKVIVRL